MSAGLYSVHKSLALQQGVTDQPGQGHAFFATNTISRQLTTARKAINSSIMHKNVDSFSFAQTPLLQTPWNFTWPTAQV